MIEMETWGAPLGFQQMTGSGVQIPTIPAGTEMMVVTTSTANIRWRDDGGTVTTSNGIRQGQTDPPLIYLGNPGSFQYIETAINSVVNFSFYGTKA